MKRGFTLVEATILVAIIAIVAAIVIPNCFGHRRERYVPDVEEIHSSEKKFRLSDGRTVTCIRGGDYSYSCDWEHAK